MMVLKGPKHIVAQIKLRHLEAGNMDKKTIYVSFYLIFKQNSSNFPNIYSENAGDNAIYMRYRDSG